MAREPAKRWLAIGLRVLAIVVVSYGASAGLVVCGGVALSSAGMAAGEAYALASMLGFLVYLAFALWSASDARLGRVYAVLLLCLVSGALVSASA